MKKKRVETNHLIIRLCLIAVKRFPENTYFSEMLIFGKGKCFHVFGCISKNFPENIFWCLEKKKENTNQKTQSHNPGKKIINDHNTRSRSRSEIAIDGARSRSGSRLRSRSDRDPRSRWRQIAIDSAIAISPSIAPSDWSWSDLAIDRAVGLELELAISDWIFSSRACALSLSLSLSLFPEVN